MDHTRLFLVFAAALLGSAARAEEFAPIKASESVTYPLPPVPFPAVPDGKWAETEDSPALRVSRAWVKLGQAAGGERTDSTRPGNRKWRRAARPAAQRKARTRGSSPRTRRTSTRRVPSTRASCETSMR